MKNAKKRTKMANNFIFSKHLQKGQMTTLIKSSFFVKEKTKLTFEQKIQRLLSFEQ